jgi:class 3 adenylate cyclase
VIGASKFIYDLWGDTVNVASRMESQGVKGGVQLTAATYQRVRRHHRCNQRTVNVKGKGPMQLYVLEPEGATRTTRSKAGAAR